MKYVIDILQNDLSERNITVIKYNKLYMMEKISEVRLNEVVRNNTIKIDQLKKAIKILSK